MASEKERESPYTYTYITQGKEMKGQEVKSQVLMVESRRNKIGGGSRIVVQKKMRATL